MLNQQGPQHFLKHPFITNSILFLFLFAIVLIADFPILTNDIMYPEQPTLYLVNQTIHSFSDFLNVYLHPKGLDDVIPFFRPSGHFLLYQALTPIFGWHNTKALIIMNMMFLALSGLLMLKLYQTLFPTYKLGGYLAVGIYLMHPSLILSRFLLMHLEFAHVFFLLFGLYCFVLFCQKNLASKNEAKKTFQFRHLELVGFALLLYAIAITFKESALMLGPLLGVYFILNFHRQLTTRQGLEIILLLLVATIFFGIYLTLAWPRLEHPFRSQMTFSGVIAVLNQFLKDLSGTQINLLTSVELPYGNGSFWRQIIFSPSAHILMLLFLFVGFMGVCWTLWEKNNNRFKQVILFLFAAVGIFLLLPCVWGMAFPWHWNLSILFLSLLLGFGFDVLSKKIVRNSLLQFCLSAVLFSWLILAAVQVNAENIANILQSNPTMRLARNAVFHPPQIQAQLTQDSIILIAAKLSEDAYLLGNATPSFALKKDFDYDKIRKKLAWLYRKYDPNYNGTLFKWAYLMPDLREEVYPFSLDKMQSIPNEVIYRWLANGSKIFCFESNNDLNWNDVTDKFRKNLLHEKERRHMSVSFYDHYYAERLAGDVINRITLPYPDSQICGYVCDQNVTCKGFTFADEETSDHAYVGCEFYNAVSNKASDDFCPSCEGYIKHSS